MSNTDTENSKPDAVQPRGLHLNLNVDITLKPDTLGLSIKSNTNMTELDIGEAIILSAIKSLFVMHLKYAQTTFSISDALATYIEECEANPKRFSKEYLNALRTAQAECAAKCTNNDMGEEQ